MCALQVLRPSGTPDPSELPMHVLRATQRARTAAAPGGLEPNVWMGAYLLRPKGAARLLALLRAAPPDVSSLVLDVWVARRVADPSAGLSAFVWDATNDLFRHGDERVSARKAANGGLVYLADVLMRSLRAAAGGDDASGHPWWRAAEGALLVLACSLSLLLLLSRACARSA